MGLTLLVACYLSTSVAAETGEEIANRLCVDCHGEYGRSETRDIPSIGGFSEFAIVDLLESYRLGFRKARTLTLEDGSENDMQQVIGTLSDDEIDAVAVYYSKQEWRPHDQAFAAEMARHGAATIRANAASAIRGAAAWRMPTTRYSPDSGGTT